MIGARGMARALTQTRAKEKKKALHARLLAQDEAKDARGNVAAYLETKRHLLKSESSEAGAAVAPAAARSSAATVAVGCEDVRGAGLAGDVHGTGQAGDVRGAGRAGDVRGAGQAEYIRHVGAHGASTVVAPLTIGGTEERLADLCGPSSQGGVAAEASGVAPAATAVETEEEGPAPAGMDAMEQVEQWHGPHHPLTHQACQREADEMAGLAFNASAAELAAAAEQSVRVLMQAVELQPGDGDLWWRCGLLLERDVRDLAGAEEKYRTGAFPSFPPPP